MITSSQPTIAGGVEQGADGELIYEALRFYFWAAGQGISPNGDQDALEPEEGFWRYCNRTGDEDWETVAERFRHRQQAEQASGWRDDAIEALGEKLFILSDRLRRIGALDSDNVHAAYEAVVAAFQRVSPPAEETGR